MREKFVFLHCNVQNLFEIDENRLTLVIPQDVISDAGFNIRYLTFNSIQKNGEDYSTVLIMQDQNSGTIGTVNYILDGQGVAVGETFDFTAEVSPFAVFVPIEFCETSDTWQMSFTIADSTTQTRTFNLSFSNISKKFLIPKKTLYLLACTVFIIKVHVKYFACLFKYLIIISELVSVCIYRNTVVAF